MRYEMWGNESQKRIVNLTSHIAHLTSLVQIFGS
jgi:hypothetical protein